jgi:indolepyruvate ferredoxin oxidoreductase beta subunit
VVEKEQPGDGIGDPLTVVDATDVAAKRMIAFDMQALAETHGSVISSAMFGALAAANVLPFGKAAFENVIKGGGKGIEASLRTFVAAYERVREKPRDAVSKAAPKRFEALPATTGQAVLDALLERIRTQFPQTAHAMLFAGVKKLVDFQDPAYAADYLDRVARLHAAGSAQWRARRKTMPSPSQAAKYLAVAMAYDDVIRVADLKVRASRFERVRQGGRREADQISTPPNSCIRAWRRSIGTLPGGIGGWVESPPETGRLARPLHQSRAAACRPARSCGSARSISSPR